MHPFTKLLAERYGGKRAALKHLRHLSEYFTGRLRKYACIDAGAVERLVFVCKGNICRSAYADAVAARHGFRAASFGLDTPGDEQADPIAMRNANARGLDLRAHRTRSSQGFILERGDLLIAMEPAQAAALQQMHGSAQVTLLGLWSSPRRPYIQDPYGRSDAYFQFCFELIETGVAGLARRLEAPNGCSMP